MKKEEEKVNTLTNLCQGKTFLCDINTAVFFCCYARSAKTVENRRKVTWQLSRAKTDKRAAVGSHVDGVDS